MEKLMLEWFEHIDTRMSHITLAVTQDWTARFREEAIKRNIKLNVVEIPFDFPSGFFNRYRVMRDLLDDIKPACVVFVQGWFAEFTLADLCAGWLATWGRVYMHENLGPEKPPERTSKKHLGFFRGVGLWWHKERFLINSRAFFCRAVLVVSKELKDRYVQWWGYPAWKMRVAYHGVDTKKYAPSVDARVSLRSRLGVAESDIMLLTTARFTRQKRLERVIEAFDYVARGQANVRLFMAGTGPQEVELRRLAESIPASNRITFLGQLDDTAEYLKMADIFILSSDNEGLSLALLEAMSSGLICVSTDCVGSSEVIKDGSNGYIVEKSSGSIGHRLEKILKLSVEDQNAMKKKASTFARENFDVTKNLQRLLKDMGITCNNSQGLD